MTGRGFARRAGALIAIDLQCGFDDAYWGRRNNLDCEANVAALLAAWRAAGAPVVFVRHDSLTPGSPLAPGAPGNALKPFMSGDPDLLVVKHVHSAFFGTPDLDGWLRERAIEAVTICGIQINVCCEATARVASDIGYRVSFVLDATHTFDLQGADGETIPAEQFERTTAATLAPSSPTSSPPRRCCAPRADVSPSRCGGHSAMHARSRRPTTTRKEAT